MQLTDCDGVSVTEDASFYKRLTEVASLGSVDAVTKVGWSQLSCATQL